jgi:hypothetical protein
MSISDPTISCPQCKTEIKLTESLAAPLIALTRERYERALAQKDQDIKTREGELTQKTEALTLKMQSIQQEVNQKILEERAKIMRQESEKARLSVQQELQQKASESLELQRILKEKDAKLTQAQAAQVAVLRKERALEEEKRELGLTVEKRVQEGLDEVRLKASKESEDLFKMKVLEKEQVILGMQRQIEELKRKSEQGSQQLQGEVQELELESLFRSKFPTDSIEPVPKGEAGGDFFQRVVGPYGVCGTILWESKRTKNWTDGWLSKLRDDQRAAKAEIAALVTQTLPKGVETFDCIDGVWVMSPKCALPVSLALRQSLIELSLARQTRAGQQTKMELVYDYLTGPAFRHRIGAIVEKFSDMQEDLDRERRSMTKLWAKREAQIRGVIEATAGMYGDLQGIAGKSFQEIEGLDHLQLEVDFEKNHKG